MLLQRLLGHDGRIQEYFVLPLQLTKYVTPFITDEFDKARDLDHVTLQVAKNRALYAFDASLD